MRESEALAYLRSMLLAVQKCRSNIMESMGGGRIGAVFEEREQTVEEWTTETTAGRVVSDLFPWLFGDRCVLPALARIMEAGTIDPAGFWNLMFIAYRPENEMLLGTFMLVTSQDMLPEPDVAWLAGWTPEEATLDSEDVPT